MNSVTLETLHWNWRQWVMLFVLTFLAQLTFIFFLSAKTRNASTQPHPQIAIQLSPKQLTESQFTETFLASDPTLFVLPNRHGFSGSAWLEVPARNYDLVEQIRPPFWLTLNSKQLGTALYDFMRTNALSPTHASEKLTPEIFHSPMPDVLASAKTKSLFRIEGDLTKRKLLHVPELESQHHSEILINTVVQVGVDPSGTVISARLISRSGNVTVDRSALETGRQLQFAPGKEMVWGNLIFDWHTVPVANTNGAIKVSVP